MHSFLSGGARQFMPGSSAPLLNLLEFQSMTRLRLGGARRRVGCQSVLDHCLDEARATVVAAHSVGHSCHKLFSVADVIFDCQGRRRSHNVCALQ
jgi:hypothetical protein